MEPPASPTPPAPPRPAKPTASPRARWLLYGCGAILALLLLLVLTVSITVWWVQRPIKPVVLSQKEKAAVDEKLRLLNNSNAAPQSSNGRANSVERNPSTTPTIQPITPEQGPGKPEMERPYIPGSKSFRLTEREINGLLNANTDLGNSVRLEFGQDAINAYLAVPIPQDFPIGGGRMFRARGRFRVSLGNGGQPFAILEDVTVFGLSLPKAWLGGLKGENLLGNVMKQQNGTPVVHGIKSLRVEPGALVLEVED